MMMATRRAVKLVGWIMALATVGGAGAKAAGPIRLVILTGQTVHDYKATTPFLERMYSDSKRFKVIETLEDMTKVTAATFAKCDAIVSNWTCHPVMTGGPWTPEGKKAFGDAIRSGKGLVQFHAACAACNDWEDFQEVSGLTWKWQSTSHTAYHTFKVVVRDTSHPITQGMGDFWITDELYQKMAKLGQSEFHTLLNAFAEPFWSGTGAWEPMLITTQLGKGRGVNFLLGHDVHAMQNIAWQTIMLRCTEWAATGKATIRIPGDWPTSAAAAAVVGVDADAAMTAAAAYAFGQGNAPMAPVEQLVIHATSRTGKTAAVDRARLAAKLAETIPACKTSEGKAFFCKQLAMIGTPEQVPVIALLLAEEQVAMMAVYALERIPGPDAARALREAFGGTTGKCRIGVANSLGNLADREAVTILGAALNDQDAEVVAACAAALGKIGGEIASKALKSLLDRTSGPSRQGVADAYLACADKLSAHGERQAAAGIYLQMYVPTEAAPIRMAALSGLVSTQGKKAAPLVIDALAGEERPLASMAAQLIRQPAGGLDPDRLLADLRHDALKSTHSEVRERAIRAMSAWPTAEPLDDFFVLSAGKLDGNQRAIVSRGIVRLIGVIRDRPPELVIEWVAKALKLAAPIEVKRDLLDQLSRYPLPAAMQLGLASMEDAELADDACAVVVRIAAGLGDANKSEVLAAMQKVIAVCKSSETVRQAEGLLHKAAKPVNLALGAEASSPDGLEPDGGSGKDQAAIDGNPETYWDETDNQKLYRFKVTFKQPTETSAIRIKGHAYHSHSPKDFEIFCDDKVVKTVTNAEYDQSSNELYVSFPTTTCTSLELKITGYYGASPGIRELEIYHIPTTGP